MKDNNKNNERTDTLSCPKLAKTIERNNSNPFTLKLELAGFEKEIWVVRVRHLNNYEVGRYYDYPKNKLARKYIRARKRGNEGYFP